MIDLKAIKEKYKSLSDEELISIAKKDSKDLKLEVVEILKEEIISRELDSKILEWINTESNEFVGQEREDLKSSIESIDCPKCKQKKGKVYGFEIEQVIGALLITFSDTYERVLCMSCGTKEKLKATLITLLFGWWSRSGILSTPLTLIKTLINFFFTNKVSDRLINDIIDSKSGQFRRKGTDIAVVKKVISNHNNNQFRNHRENIFTKFLKG